nr:EAL domain-containing protein [Marinibactrum halimedae]
MHRVFHDELTNLPNRLLLKERIEHSIKLCARENTMMAVLFIDLDGFKRINDAEGHTAGDGLLKEIALRLEGIIRDQDTLARLTSDEFVILQEAVTSQHSVRQLCKRIHDSIAYPIELGEKSFHITCCVGISIYPRDDNDPDALLRKADMAMYRAKEMGRSCVQFYSDSMERYAIYQVEMQRKLFVALEQGLLTLYFQPEIDVKTGEVIQLEALVRWINPDGSMISPAEFIPMAEKMGMINNIGDYILNEACAHIRRWNQQGYDRVVVAVNLSVREFQQTDFIEKVKNTILSHGISARSLVFEITESVFMEDMERVLKVMHEFKRFGIRFAVDDFGTGFSSFSYLQKLPVDFLKIDRSLVQSVVQGVKESAVVECIVDIGRHLQMKVVAEGIEDEVTLLHLERLNCDYAQGFFICRPQPAEEMEPWLSRLR